MREVILVYNTYQLADLKDSIIYSFGETSVLEVVSDIPYKNYIVPNVSPTQLLERLKLVWKDNMYTSYLTNLKINYIDPSGEFKKDKLVLSNLIAAYYLAKTLSETTVNFYDICCVKINLVLATALTLLENFRDSIDSIEDNLSTKLTAINNSTLLDIKDIIW